MIKNNLTLYAWCPLKRHTRLDKPAAESGSVF